MLKRVSAFFLPFFLLFSQSSTAFATAVPSDSWKINSGGAISVYSLKQSNIQRMDDIEVSDLFSGGAKFSFPLAFPGVLSGTEPNLSLEYSSLNRDAQSPYGYGWGLTVSEVSRTGRYWPLKAYETNELLVDGKEFVDVGGSYKPRIATDAGKLEAVSGGWLLTDGFGTKKYYGLSSSARSSDEIGSKTFRWMLEKEERSSGEKIVYSYGAKEGVPYLQSVRYAFSANGTALYEIFFEYSPRTKAPESYRTGYRTKTSDILTRITLRTEGVATRSYELSHDSLQEPFPHLLEIQETVGQKELPPTSFVYGSGKFSHLLVHAKLPGSGEMDLSYVPSTNKTASGDRANPRLPVVTMNLSETRFHDPITGSTWTRKFSYEGGKLYFDASDPFRREYVGFGKTVATEADGTQTTTFFHQGTIGSATDTLPKKGYPYRIETRSASGKLVGLSVTNYVQKPLDHGRIFVAPESAISFDFGTASGVSEPLAKAVKYAYDDYGNTIKVEDFGSVSADPSTGNFTDTGSDLLVTENSYTEDIQRNVVSISVSKKTSSQDGTELSYSRTLYDGMPFGAVGEKILPTGAETKDVMTGRFVGKTFDYDGFGRLSGVTDELGNVTEYSADPYGTFFQTVRNPKGFETSYRYDYATGKMSGTTDPNGLSKNVGYDGFGRPVTETAMPSGGTGTVLKRWSYGDESFPMSVTVAESGVGGERSSISYFDGFGRQIQTRASSFASGAYWISDVAYGPRGTIKFASYPYESAGTEYTASGTFTYGTAFEYDALGRATAKTDGDGTSSVEYGPGFEISTDKLEWRKKLSYDARGNLTEVREAYGTSGEAATRYSYSPLGQLTEYRDASGNFRKLEYDGFLRVSKLEELHRPTDSSVPYETYEYDDADNLVRSVDQLGNTTTSAYDALGRQISQRFSKPDGTVDRAYGFAYDENANAKGFLTSESGSTYSRSYLYDAFGRRTEERTAIMAGSSSKEFATKFSYADTGEMTGTEYPDGYSVTYGYSTGFPESVSVGGEALARITGYSPSGKPSAFSFGQGLSETYSFDAAHGYRLAGKKAVTASGTTLQDLSYSYDAENQIVGLAESAPTLANRNVSYSYDVLGRLISADYGSGALQSFSYDAIGDILSGPMGPSYSYAANSVAGNPHALVSAGNFSYHYDTEGNLAQRMETVGSGSLTTNFRYDAGNRLVNVRGADGGVDFSYSYDANDTRLFKRDYEENAATFYPNDFFEVEYDRYAQSGLTTLTTTIDRHVFFGGLRIATSRTVSSETASVPLAEPQTGTPTESGSTSIGETSVANPPDTWTGASGSGTDSWSADTSSWSTEPPTSSGSETPPETGTGSTEPTWGMEPQTVTGSAMEIPNLQLAAEIDSGTWTRSVLAYHLTDHLGSATLDVDPSGTILVLKDYYPFGEERISIGSSEYGNRYSFGNKERDSESSLSYFENRYYDSLSGRFTQRDPVFKELGRTKRAGGLLADPQQFNSYSYARNNPVRFTDPTGEIVDTAIDAAFFAWDSAGLLTGMSEFTGSWATKKYGEWSGNAAVESSWRIGMSRSTATIEEKGLDVAIDGISLTSPGVSAPMLKSGVLALPLLKGAERMAVKDAQSSWKGFVAKTVKKITNKDYDKRASDLGLSKVKWTNPSHWKPVYKDRKWSYYSPDADWHNATFWWKKGTLDKSGNFQRKSTLDSNLKEIKK